MDRARAMVERLAGLGVPGHLGAGRAIAGGGVVGRPHMARAMAAAGVDRRGRTRRSGPEWIGDGGRAHVARYALDPARAIAPHPGRGRGGRAGPPAGGARGWTGARRGDRRPGRGRAVRHRGLAPGSGRRPAGVTCGLWPPASAWSASGGSDDHGELTGFRIGSDTIAADACRGASLAGARRRPAGARGERRGAASPAAQRARRQD